MRPLAAALLCVCLSLLFACSVKHNLRKEPVPKAAKNGSLATTAATATSEKKTLAVSQDVPVDIRSDRMRYQNQGQVTIFQGHVQVVQPKAVMQTPYLEVRSNQGLAYARQGVRLEDYTRGMTVTAQELDYSKNLSDVEIRNQVKVKTQDEKGQTLMIQSKKLEWHADKDEALATGAVVVHYQNTTATAETIHFQSAADKLVLSSEPKDKLPEMQRGPDRISGQVITVYPKEKIYEVDGMAKAIIQPQAAAKQNSAEKKP